MVSLKHLRVVLTCIFLITADMGHLVMRLLVICFLFHEGPVCKSFARFSIEFLFLFDL